MPQFAYTAIDAATGAERSDVIEGVSAEAVKTQLMAEGWYATEVKLTMGTPKAPVIASAPAPVVAVPIQPAPRRAASARVASPKAVAGKPSPRPVAKSKPKSGWQRSFGPVVDRKGLMVFTRQMYVLLNAGMPILRALELLGRQEKRPGFAAVINQIAEAIRSGGSFSDGLLAHPKVFNRLYGGMVRAGEAGGVLTTVLQRLAVFLEKAEKTRGKVKSAMLYPIILVTLAVGVVATLMIVVVPKFEDIFATQLKGQSLPALTQGVMNVSYFLQAHYLLVVGVVAAVVVGFRLTLASVPGRRLADTFLLRAPIVGDLNLKAAVARFSRTFGTLLASGVPILQALTITRETSENVVLASALGLVHDRVKEGEGVTAPLESTRVFPHMVTGMIEVGEETGKLPEMLQQVADTYDEEVDTAVAGLTTLLEPVMIVFMAVVVGTIVIALFLPIVRIVQSLS